MLSRTVMVGKLPSDLTVQVLATKTLEAKHDNNIRVRVKLWDGDKLYDYGLLVTNSTQPAPVKFSIIRLGTEQVPMGGNVETIREMRDGVYAYMFHHFKLVKHGDDVGRKLIAPTTGNNYSDKASSNSMSTPPTRQHVEPPQVRPRAAAARVSDSSSPLRSPMRDRVKRNLEESYPSPHKRANTADELTGREQETHKIEAINPMMNKYTLKVRVSQKRDIRDISTSRWQGKVINCVLGDSSGEIMITAFEEYAETLFKELENGKTYLLTGAKIQPIRDPRFNSTGHSFELNWTPNTRVTGPLRVGCVAVNYKFSTISDIKVMPVDRNCDVCAWAKETGQLVEFRSKSDKDLKKREVVLADDSEGGSSISLTLWDKAAQNFTADQKILAIKGAKVGEWNNCKNLSIGFTGSYEVEPEHPRVLQLAEWASQLRDTSNQSLSQLSASSSGEEFGFTTIQELKDTLLAHQGQKKCRLYAWVTKINEENIMYRAHTDGSGCYKKVTEVGRTGLFQCSKCGKQNISECDTTLRFTLRLSIADFTGTSWCTMFDAESLLKKSTKEMNELMKNDFEAYENFLMSKTLVPLIFDCSAKIETFKDSPRLKIVINQASQVNWTDSKVAGTTPWAELVRPYVAQVHAIEAELGVVHDIVLGTTWDESLEVGFA